MELNRIAAWLLTVFVHLGLLLMLARLLTSRMESGAWRERLWRVALGGALLTASLQSAVGNGPLVWHMPSAASVQGVPVALGTPNAASVAPDVALGGSVFGLGTASADPASPARPPFAWLAWSLVAVWLSGALVIAYRQQRARRTFLAQLHREPVSDSPEIHERLKRLGLVGARVQLSVSSSLGSPVVLSQGEICLPTRMLEEFSAEEFDATLAHELGHVLRRDPLWLRVYALIEAVFFFQPLVKTATAALRAEAELACDDWAVKRGADPLGLARSLARIAAWEPLAPIGMSAMLGGESGLVARVQRLTSARSRRESRTRDAVCVAALALGLGVFACGGPSIDSSPAPADEESTLVLHVRAGGELQAGDRVFQPPADWPLFRSYLAEQDTTPVDESRGGISNMPVLIQVDPGVRFGRVQMLLENLGQAKVWNISFATHAQGTMHSPLPNDFDDLPMPVEESEEESDSTVTFGSRTIGTDLEPSENIEILLRLNGTTPRQLQYSLEATQMDTLAKVALIILERTKMGGLKSVTIDARSGIVYKDVIALMDTIRTSSGQPDLPIYFVGAYDSDWR